MREFPGRLQRLSGLDLTTAREVRCFRHARPLRVGAAAVGGRDAATPPGSHGRMETSFRPQTTNRMDVVTGPDSI